MNGSTITDAMFYKGAVKRQGMALQSSNIDDELPISERIGAVPQEWREKWWMEKTKHVADDEMLSIFTQN